jgi:hypothetical protein
MTTKLDLEDIQYLALARAPAITGRYEFLSFQDAAGGRRWLSALLDKVRSVADAKRSQETDQRWISLAFTASGLRALGLSDAALATFPEEFRAGMAARAEVLGDTGAQAPANWKDGTAEDRLHASVILFARSDTEHARCVAEHAKLVAGCPGVELVSSLDLLATPPFDYAHDHFGYRDRM